MKIISLNTWGGLAGKELLLSFFEKYKKSTDIFCLQEIWSAPYSHLTGKLVGGRVLSHEKIMHHGLRDISKVLEKTHNPYFRPHFLEHYGLLMFVKKGLEVVEDGDIFVHKYKGYMPEGDVGGHARNIQYVTLKNKKDLLTIVNFHGLWNGKGKGDSEDRLIQSNNIVNFMKNLKTPIIFCGDFNLRPDTESLKKFEDTGLVNLIKKYKITSTRTSFYTKPEKFADYAFVSDDLKVKYFKVMKDEVSDHSPLFVELK